MNRTYWIVAAAVIVIMIAIACFVFVQHSSPTISPASTNVSRDENGNATVGANGTSQIIAYTDTGFSPAQQTIDSGTTVTWNNQSSHTLWVQAAGSSNSDCSPDASSTVLNECSAVSSGGSYSFTFTHAGTFTYANHDKPTDTGSITVIAGDASANINPDAIPE